jgi:hypothetical protein
VDRDDGGQIKGILPPLTQEGGSEKNIKDVLIMPVYFEFEFFSQTY